MVLQCAKCGAAIAEDEGRLINQDTPHEYAVCETCFDSMWDNYEVTDCANCGRWFDANLPQTEAFIGTDSFTPCPVCGHDIVDGETKAERLAESAGPAVEPHDVWVVTSLRLYENEEMYFGCDGVFSDPAAAKAFVIGDMKQILAEEENAYEEAEEADVIDFINCHLEINGHSYFWQIDQRKEYPHGILH